MNFASRGPLTPLFPQAAVTKCGVMDDFDMEVPVVGAGQGLPESRGAAQLGRGCDCLEGLFPLLQVLDVLVRRLVDAVAVCDRTLQRTLELGGYNVESSSLSRCLSSQLQQNFCWCLRTVGGSAGTLS